MSRTSISPLQLQSPFNGLEIDEHGLRLDADPPAPAGDHGVPRAKIAGDRKWHLRPPAKARVELSPQPLEEPLLTGVPNRVAAGIGAHPQLQPDGRRETREQFAVDPTRVPTFDPALRRGADAARQAELPPAEPARPPTERDLGTNPMFVLGDHPSRAVRLALPGRHRERVCAAAMHLGLRDGCARDAHSVGWMLARTRIRGTRGATRRRAVRGTHGFATRHSVLRRSVLATHVGAGGGPGAGGGTHR